jgi:hypothetical protein
MLLDFMIACFSTGIDLKSRFIVVPVWINLFTGSFLFTKGGVFGLSGESLVYPRFAHAQMGANGLHIVANAPAAGNPSGLALFNH